MMVLHVAAIPNHDTSIVAFIVITARVQATFLQQAQPGAELGCYAGLREALGCTPCREVLVLVEVMNRYGAAAL